jgi:hypothetical protein
MWKVYLEDGELHATDTDTDNPLLLGKDGQPMCWDTREEAEEFIRLANRLGRTLCFKMEEAIEDKAVVGNLFPRFKLGEEDEE